MLAPYVVGLAYLCSDSHLVAPGCPLARRSHCRCLLAVLRALSRRRCPSELPRKNCIREDASLMQKLDAEEATPQAKSNMAGRIRSFDSKISKIIKDNFQGWTSSQVDVLQRDSMTLRQRIARDKGISPRPKLQPPPPTVTTLRGAHPCPDSTIHEFQDLSQVRLDETKPRRWQLLVTASALSWKPRLRCQ